jgi:hypothetical protein
MSLALCNLTKSAANVAIKKNYKTHRLLLGIPTISHGQSSPFFELALVLVRFDDVASIIVNANHSTM